MDSVDRNPALESQSLGARLKARDGRPVIRDELYARVCKRNLFLGPNDFYK